MRFLFVSDSFKGSLSSQKINGILEKVSKKHFPDCETKSFITADGGEGTLEAIKNIKGGKYIFIPTKNPLLKEIESKYLVYDDCAVIAVSETIGLNLIESNERNPLETSSYGVGELILNAVKNGYKNIIITLGGSSTCDGGMGAFVALGVKFTDKNGNILDGKGKNLLKIYKIDTKNLYDFKDVKFTVLCDVKNPLLGKNGASYVFAPQKGADIKMVEELEKGMNNYAIVVKNNLKKETDFESGGAAGGLGMAFKVFLNAEIKSGIDYILEINDFDNEIKKADFVFSGEGQIDSQSKDGKVISGIAKICKKYNKPLVIIVGSVGKNIEKLYDLGVTSVFSIVNKPMQLNEAIENSTKLYYDLADNVFRLLKVSNT